MPLKFQTKMDAEPLSTELAASDVMKNSSELKTISVFISANLYDAFTFIFLINLVSFFIYYKYSNLNLKLIQKNKKTQFPSPSKYCKLFQK